MRSSSTVSVRAPVPPVPGARSTLPRTCSATATSGCAGLLQRARSSARAVVSRAQHRGGSIRAALRVMGIQPGTGRRAPAQSPRDRHRDARRREPRRHLRRAARPTLANAPCSTASARSAAGALHRGRYRYAGKTIDLTQADQVHRAASPNSSGWSWCLCRAPRETGVHPRRGSNPSGIPLPRPRLVAGGMRRTCTIQPVLEVAIQSSAVRGLFQRDHRASQCIVHGAGGRCCSTSKNWCCTPTSPGTTGSSTTPLRLDDVELAVSSLATAQPCAVRRWADVPRERFALGNGRVGGGHGVRTSAKYWRCAKRRLHPGRDHDLSSLRAILSTAARSRCTATTGVREVARNLTSRASAVARPDLLLRLGNRRCLCGAGIAERGLGWRGRVRSEGRSLVASRVSWCAPGPSQACPSVSGTIPT